MCSACGHAERMTKMIQIRNVPDEMHRELKARAAKAGMSLSDYLLAEIRSVAERPTLEEVFERIEKLVPVELPPGETPAEAVRRERESR